MPYKVCIVAGCPYPARPGESRCFEHQAEQRKQSRSEFNSFYASAPWRWTRRKQLLAHPFCQNKPFGRPCDRLADSVHHVVELQDGGAPRDPANLLSVCRRCHSLIHAQRRHRDAA